MIWPLVKLHDICRPKQWKTIAASNLLESGYPVYGANGKIGFYSEFTHELPTLMITCRGATCGNVHISEPKSYINGNAMALDDIDSTDVDLKYLYYFFLKRGFDDVISGSAQPQITGQGLTKVEIPLPPVDEQKRIAAILDKADAIRRKRQQAIQLADDFLRSIFLEMFGDPVTNPNGWEMRTLGELVAKNDRINYGIVQPGVHIDGGVPIVRVGDFKNGLIDKSNLKCVSSEIDEKHKKSRLFGDEILITCVGATIGKVALADPSLEGFNTVRAVTRIRLNKKVNRHYVFRYLQSPFIQQYFLKQLRTVGQPTLNGAQISETPILIPEEKYQNKYLDISTRMESWLKKVSYHNDDASESFASLAQEAFLGRL